MTIRSFPRTRSLSHLGRLVLVVTAALVAGASAANGKTERREAPESVKPAPSTSASGMRIYADRARGLLVPLSPEPSLREPAPGRPIERPSPVPGGGMVLVVPDGLYISMRVESTETGTVSYSCSTAVATGNDGGRR